MQRPAYPLALGLLALILGSGCGGIWYTSRVLTVESKVEQAKEIGAEMYSPYEYYLAKEHLIKAQEEAAHADYSDAIDLLDEAEVFAKKAIEQTGAVRKGAGR